MAVIMVKEGKAFNIGAFRTWARTQLEPNPFYIPGNPGTQVGIPDGWPSRSAWNFPVLEGNSLLPSIREDIARRERERPEVVWYLSVPPELVRRGTYL